jgi:hypothetical protein
MKIDFKPSKKQHEAFTYLSDRGVNVVLYGGAAGGGKSYLGCAWVILSCLRYSGIRVLVGRKRLRDIVQSTKVTFNEVLRDFGLVNYVHYKWNNRDNTCTFENGSIVVFVELSDLPSDKEFERLGSTPYTFAFIEEAGQVSEKAFEVVRSRLRWLLDKYDLTPKVLLTCNPSKNWLYKVIYKPYVTGTLPSEYRFVQAFVDDNPNKRFVEIYRKNLENIRDDITRERLLAGNWEYSDSDLGLCSYDNLIGIFDNDLGMAGDYYITADISRYGDNETVIYLWRGLVVKERYVLSYERTNKQALVKTADFIKELVRSYGVSICNVVVDEDGVGGGVVDMLPGCVGFVGSSRPKNDRFMNLKSECAYKLGDLINDRLIGCEIDDVGVQEKIVLEISSYKKKNLDTDRRLGISSKEEVKKLLSGRSPDDADNFIMRMYFEVVGGSVNTDVIGCVGDRGLKGIDLVFSSRFNFLELEEVFGEN